MSKKISVILIFIVILISLFLSIYFPNKGKIESEDISINYSTIEKNGKFGIIDQDENIIIEPQYEKIIIVNPHKAVFVCQLKDEQKIVNNKNQEIFQKYDNVQPIEISNGIYEKDILIYEKEGEYGLLSINGETITNAKYEEISSLGYQQGPLLSKKDGKYGILHGNGNTIIKNKYDEIQLDEYYTEENQYQKAGYIVKVTTEQGYRYGYYDYEGIQVLEEEYNQITRLSEIKSDNIYLIAAKNGQYGVFVNNSKIINTEYQTINYNTDMEMFIVEKTDKYGAINLKGVQILQTEYSELTINGIYLYSVKNGEQKVFNQQGNEINIPFNTIINKTSNSKYFIRNDVGNYSIVNTELKKLTKQNYKFIEHAYETYFIVTNEQDKVGMIDLEENVIVEYNYDLIQIIKGKNIVQAIDFSTNKTDIYDDKFDLSLEITNANIELLADGIRVYNNEQESFLDDNGKIITK
ncbi:MAG: WG repeat-containing protein [Clostridia bacterium]|nr:WG repeat-containing protein [Clostridia bacterium]